MADIYLKITGIDIAGESTDEKHKDWIEVDSFNAGVAQPVSQTSGTGGRTAAGAHFQDFVIAKTVDKSTPELDIQCAKGTHFSEVKMEVCVAAGDETKHPYLVYTLSDVIISNVSINGGTGMRPAETVSFNYGKIKWAYTSIDHTGKPGATIDRTWNLETNKPG